MYRHHGQHRAVTVPSHVAQPPGATNPDAQPAPRAPRSLQQIHEQFSATYTGVQVPLIENATVERRFGAPEFSTTRNSEHQSLLIREAIEERYRDLCGEYDSQVAVQHFQHMLPIVEWVRGRQVEFDRALDYVKNSSPVDEVPQQPSARLYTTPPGYGVVEPPVPPPPGGF